MCTIQKQRKQLLAWAIEQGMSGPIPIIQQRGIYLAGDSVGNAWRFIEVFRNTWKQLPLWTRRHHLKYWREDELGLVWSPFCSPWIRLVPQEWCDRGGRTYIARCYGRGHCFNFRQPFVDLMPDGVLACLIARVIACAVDFAQGNAPDESKDHSEADLRMVEWGFDPGLLAIWIHRFLENGRLREHPLRPLTPKQEHRFRQRLGLPMLSARGTPIPWRQNPLNNGGSTQTPSEKDGL